MVRGATSVAECSCAHQSHQANSHAQPAPCCSNELQLEIPAIPSIFSSIYLNHFGNFNHGDHFSRILRIAITFLKKKLVAMLENSNENVVAK
jgi:hypothetical protein